MKFNFQKKMPWIFSLGMAVVSGQIVSSLSHEYLTNNISTRTPGKIQLEYVQANPGGGKAYSLASLAVAMFSLYKITESDKEDSEKAKNNFISGVSSSLPSFALENSKNSSQSSNRASKGSFDSSSVDFDVNEFTKDAFEALEEEAAKVPVTANQDNSVKDSFNKIDRKLFEMIYNANKKHFLVPAETRAGKTSLLLGVMDYITEVTKGHAQFYLSTAKPTSYGGLETLTAKDGKSHVLELSFTKLDSILSLLSRLNWLVKLMESRQLVRQNCEKNNIDYNPTPILIFIDEWLATLKIADDFDREINSTKAKEDPVSKVRESIISIVETIVILGAEDNIGVWLFCQDHLVKNCEINTGYQKSFNLLIPTRKGAMNSIKSALVGSYPVVRLKIGEILMKTLTAYFEENPKASFVYSNITGEDEILEVPFMPDIKRKNIFASPVVVETVKNPFGEAEEVSGEAENISDSSVPVTIIEEPKARHLGLV